MRKVPGMRMLDGHFHRQPTVVSGGDVRISKVAISHGDLKISIANYNTASQPSGVWGASPGIQTAIVTNTVVDVNESTGPGYVPPGNNTVADLIQSLNKLKTSTRDVISILRAVQRKGRGQVISNSMQRRSSRSAAMVFGGVTMDAC